MIAELLLATALAAPLDDAAADGRPIIVLLDREDWASNQQLATWLVYAGPNARKALSQLTLVYATPAQVEAWTGGEVADDDRMVRIDPARRRLAAHAAFALVEPPDNPQEPNPGDHFWLMDHDPESALAAFEELRTAERAAGVKGWAIALAEVPTTWDQALLLLLDGARMTARPPQALEVMGAERCRTAGCTVTCDRTGAEDDSIMCGMGHVTPFMASFLKRWPPETP